MRSAAVYGRAGPPGLSVERLAAGGYADSVRRVLERFGVWGFPYFRWAA